VVNIKKKKKNKGWYSQHCELTFFHNVV